MINQTRAGVVARQTHGAHTIERITRWRCFDAAIGSALFALRLFYSWRLCLALESDVQSVRRQIERYFRHYNAAPRRADGRVDVDR